jgi:hypothetical protein
MSSPRSRVATGGVKMSYFSKKNIYIIDYLMKTPPNTHTEETLTMFILCNLIKNKFWIVRETLIKFQY